MHSVSKMQNAFNVKPGCTYSNHCALDGYNVFSPFRGLVKTAG
jgi:hypothetical protein